MLTTNSPADSAWVTLCFCLPRRSREPLKKTVGGLAQTALKKEYGATLSTPATLVVLIHPIGRGTTALTRCW